MKVMLFCGAGLSSGFMAQAMRKYAKKKDYDMEVFAVGEAEIKSRIKEVQALLVSPHYAMKLEDPDMLEMAKKNNVFLMQIDSQDYGMVDGESVVEKLRKKMRENNE